jgi:hypothetical protein
MSGKSNSPGFPVTPDKLKKEGVHMQENLPLTKLLNHYSTGRISKKELENRIFKYILDNYRQFHPYKWSEEDYSDYICWLYPRISRAIVNYRDIGSSFDAYINSLLRWSAKEYRAKEKDRQIVEYTCWKANAMEETSCNEAEPEYLEPISAFDEVSNPRQVLVLLLKSYCYLSDDFLERAAPAIRIDKETLKQMVRELRKTRLERDEKIKELKERIYGQFYRCMAMEKQLTEFVPYSDDYKEAARRLSRGRQRLASMRRHLANMKTGASNRQVAKILESAKGTVDAHLFTVKSKWKSKDDGVSDENEDPLALSN